MMLFFAVAGCSSPETEDTRPDPDDPEAIARIAQELCRSLPALHFSRRALDDEISRRTYDALLGELDPLKLVLRDGDAEAFSASRESLDDELCAGSLATAFDLHDKLLARQTAWLDLVDPLIDEAFDFNRESKVVTDGELAAYAESDSDVVARWRTRVKFDLALMLAAGEEEDEARRRLHSRYKRRLQAAEQTPPSEIAESFLTSVTGSYDPHSTYMTQSSWQRFRAQLELSLVGLGVVLRDGDYGVMVDRVVPGGGAARDSELAAGDRIVGVGEGKDGPIEDMENTRFKDVLKALGGPENSFVRLEVVPKGKSERVVYTIKRTRIALPGGGATSPDEEAQGVEEFEHPSGRTVRIGVVDLPSFYASDTRSATDDVAEQIEKLKEDNVDVIILDLSRNGGGRLSEAQGIAGLFLDKGPVTLVKDANGDIEDYDDPSPGALWDGPLVVHVSKHSASASEIVAGALQDYDRAILVGDSTSHGKGTVQYLLYVAGQSDRDGVMKLTTSKFYRPTGETTQRDGTNQDITFVSLTDVPSLGEAHLPYALPADSLSPDEIAPFSFVPTGHVDDELRRGLRDRSLARRADGRFDKVEAERKRRIAEAEKRELVFTLDSLRTAVPASGLKPGEVDELVRSELFHVAADLALASQLEEPVAQARLDSEANVFGPHAI